MLDSKLAAANDGRHKENNIFSSSIYLNTLWEIGKPEGKNRDN